MEAVNAMSEMITVCRSAQLTPAAYRFYRAVLLAFVERGGPPDQAYLRRQAQRFSVRLAVTLADFAAKGLIRRDLTTGSIRVAYPFSAEETAHRVTLAPASGDIASNLEPRQVFAMCALDALGIPFMLRRSALIASQDALTGEPVGVSVTITDAAHTNGTGCKVRWSPVGTVVYARAPEHEHDCGVDAASACCPIINFFAAEAHAREWAEAHLVTDGVLLTQEEALRRAGDLFGMLLDRI
jgi:hypothetical protein